MSVMNRTAVPAIRAVIGLLFSSALLVACAAGPVDEIELMPAPDV